jgi:hypothetical protein
MSVLLFVLLWLLITLPFALLVGKCCKAGNAAGDIRVVDPAEQAAVRGAASTEPPSGAAVPAVTA